jgi:hypothetical protein
MDALTIFAYIMGTFFVVGGIGCVFAIPVIAYKMFSVLFEDDHEEVVPAA